MTQLEIAKGICERCRLQTPERGLLGVFDATDHPDYIFVCRTCYDTLPEWAPYPVCYDSGDNVIFRRDAEPPTSTSERV